MSHDDDTCPHLVRANLLEAENARLKAEVKRLTKAGDAMSDQLLCDYGDNPLTYAWHSAKEGKQS